LIFKNCGKRRKKYFEQRFNFFNISTFFGMFNGFFQLKLAEEMAAHKPLQKISN
jgi:hypothetical protein